MSEGRSLMYSQVLSCRPYVSKELTTHLSKDVTPMVTTLLLYSSVGGPRQGWPVISTPHFIHWGPREMAVLV